jgi:hypothetical protein
MSTGLKCRKKVSRNTRGDGKPIVEERGVNPGNTEERCIPERIPQGTDEKFQSTRNRHDRTKSPKGASFRKRIQENSTRKLDKKTRQENSARKLGEKTRQENAARNLDQGSSQGNSVRKLGKKTRKKLGEETRHKETGTETWSGNAGRRLGRKCAETQKLAGNSARKVGKKLVQEPDKKTRRPSQNWRQKIFGFGPLIR